MYRLRSIPSIAFTLFRLTTGKNWGRGRGKGWALMHLLPIDKLPTSGQSAASCRLLLLLICHRPLQCPGPLPCRQQRLRTTCDRSRIRALFIQQATAQRRSRQRARAFYPQTVVMGRHGGHGAADSSSEGNSSSSSSEGSNSISSSNSDISSKWLRQQDDYIRARRTI